jgi:hypothetical protein
MGVEAAFTSVYPALSNGTVEKANTLILEDQLKDKWAEELLRVVWSHNTSVYRAMKFTPFKILYGEESITPEEIKLRNARTRVEASYSPSEAESKDFLEPECIRAVENL